MRLAAPHCSDLLSRFLSRFFAGGIFTADSPFKVLVTDLQIVGFGDDLAVPHPRTDDVGRELVGQLGLPARPQILEQPRPVIEARAGDHLLKLRAQIGILLAISRDDVQLAVAGLIKDRLQVRPQLGEDWDEASSFTLVMFGLARSHQHPAVGPVDISPGQRQMLTRAPKAAVSAQSDQQLPLGVEGFGDHRVDGGPVNEPLSLGVAGRSDLHATERVLRHQLALDSVAPDGAGLAHHLDGVGRRILAGQIPAEVFRLGDVDGARVADGTEEVDRMPLRLFNHQDRSRLQIGPPLDVRREHRVNGEHGRRHLGCPGLSQASTDNALVKLRADCGEPGGGQRWWRGLGDCRGIQMGDVASDVLGIFQRHLAEPDDFAAGRRDDLELAGAVCGGGNRGHGVTWC